MKCLRMELAKAHRLPTLQGILPLKETPSDSGEENTVSGEGSLS
jgi:hypothetical protein